jgi:hypothetical protein
VSSLIGRLFRSVRKHGVAGFLRRAAGDAANIAIAKAATRRDHHGEYSVSGVPRGNDVAIVVLAGYKPDLWPLTLERIRRYAPASADVCIATAGKHDDGLAALCAHNGWTYVTTRSNKTGLVLNKAIEAHPKAARWFKLDEDIFIPPGFFDDLAQAHDALKWAGIYAPGFSAPMLNVNGVSYRGFLQRMGLEDDYVARFGPAREAAGGIPAHYDPEAARWLWRHTVPLNAVADRLRAGVTDPLHHARLIGTRFSIGAIYFERDFWTEIGGFQSAFNEGVLGVDETGICTECMLRSRPMFYFTHILAGHFSFYPQEQGMLALVPELKERDPDTFTQPAPAGL